MLLEPFVVGLALVPIFALNTVRQSALQGLGRVVVARVPETLIVPLAFLVLVLIADSVLGDRLTATWAVAANAAAAILALTVGAVCILSGWRHAEGREARLRLLWTQVLHWGAFLAAMNIVLLPGVQRVLTSSATGLTLLMLLALGTFVAGIHLSLRICMLGLTMALFVPAIAWLKQSAIFLLLAAIALVGIAIAVWWVRASSRAPEAPR